MKATLVKDIDGLIIIEPDCHGDHRGWFMESYSKPKFEKIGISCEFVQDNHSYSAKKGVLRGLHFQNAPYTQAKLIRCTRGAIMDFVVDLRSGSPSYKKWTKVELSAQNQRQFFIPGGFAHGFLTLSDEVEIQYKVDKVYSAEHDRSIRYDDPALSVDFGVSNPILSDKDANAPLLKDSDINF